jgi:hypothetical protein
VDACYYRPGKIAYILEQIEILAHSGMEPSEALMSTLDIPESPYERQHQLAAWGPSEPEGAKLLAELNRARQAGHRTPWAISAFLCPQAPQDEEGAR